MAHHVISSPLSLMYISITFNLISKFRSTFLYTNFHIRFEFSRIKYPTNILTPCKYINANVIIFRDKIWIENFNIKFFTEEIFLWLNEEIFAIKPWYFNWLVQIDWLNFPFIKEKQCKRFSRINRLLVIFIHLKNGWNRVWNRMIDDAYVHRHSISRY